MEVNKNPKKEFECCALGRLIRDFYVKKFKTRKQIENDLPEETTVENELFINIPSFDNSFIRATEFKLRPPSPVPHFAMTEYRLQEFDEEIEIAKQDCWAKHLQAADSIALKAIEEIIRETRASIGREIDGICNCFYKSKQQRPAYFNGKQVMERSVKLVKQKVNEEFEKMKSRPQTFCGRLKLELDTKVREAVKTVANYGKESEDVELVEFPDLDDISGGDYWAISSSGGA